MGCNYWKLVNNYEYLNYIFEIDDLYNYKTLYNNTNTLKVNKDMPSNQLPNSVLIANFLTIK
jgi:hypothetical protein